MAENENGQDKTEEPTAKRLQDAREKGQVARSKELNTLMVLLAAGGAALFVGPMMMERFLTVFQSAFVIERAHIFDPTAMVMLLSLTFYEALLSLSPLFIVIILAAVLSPMALSGWNFSTQAMAIKPEKLDPVKGLKRIFGWQGLVEMLKALAKFVLLSAVALGLLWFLKDDFLTIGNQSVEAAMAQLGQLMVLIFLVVSVAMILIVVIDIPFQLWNHKRQLRMTKQEVRDERKQTDGNPEVKGRIRRLQMEMAQKRMMQKVPQADVIVTNPEHYSVALRYNPDGPSAPVVVAKGVDLVAMQIRILGQTHNVPLIRAPALARAIYYSTELEQEIPAGLYMAVAQVLAHVFQLRDGEVDEARSFEDDALPIPPELQRAARPSAAAAEAGR